MVKMAKLIHPIKSAIFAILTLLHRDCWTFNHDLANTYFTLVYPTAMWLQLNRPITSAEADFTMPATV